MIEIKNLQETYLKIEKMENNIDKIEMKLDDIERELSS